MLTIFIPCQQDVYRSTIVPGGVVDVLYTSFVCVASTSMFSAVFIYCLKAAILDDRSANFCHWLTVITVTPGKADRML